MARRGVRPISRSPPRRDILDIWAGIRTDGLARAADWLRHHAAPSRVDDAVAHWQRFDPITVAGAVADSSHPGDTPPSRLTSGWVREREAPQTRCRTLGCENWLVKPPRRSAVAKRLLFQEFLGNEDVPEHAREGDHENHLQDDADTRDIAADLTESTTHKRLHKPTSRSILMVMRMNCNSRFLN